AFRRRAAPRRNSPLGGQRPAQRRSVGVHQTTHPGAYLADREARDVGDGHTVEAHGTRLGVESGAGAAGADLVAQAFDLGFGKALFAPLLVVSAHRVVERLALLTRQPRTCAHAVGAPAVLAVVGEQAWVEF